MASSTRQSFLSYDPIKFSLTDGTNIPPPQESPPPTSNGSKAVNANGATDSAHQLEPPDANHGQSRPPHSPGPASLVSKSTSPRRHGVRRLFSLGSLRSSFTSSRASLSLPRESVDDHHAAAVNGTKRPSSPSASFTATASSQRPPTQATMRKNQGWFRRKSGMGWANGNHALGTIGEDGRPESKRAREHSPPPLLPEIKSLAGGDLKDGEVEWDEKLFRKAK